MKYLITILILLIPIAVYAEEAQQSISINDIRVLKISPQDQRAVVKTQDRKLKILNVGDVLHVKRSYQRSAVPVNPNGLGHGAGSDQQSQEESVQRRSEQRSAFRNQHRIVQLKVVEIAEGRVVLEEETEGGIETVIIRLVDGKQTVEKIKRTPDEQPVFYKTNNDEKSGQRSAISGQRSDKTNNIGE